MASAWSAGARGFSASNVASLATAAFTISGSDKYLRTLAYAGAGTPAAVSTVVWDAAGVNEGLTSLDAAITFNTNFRGSTWRKIGPTDGTSKTVTVTWASNQDETMVIADNYTGVDQATPTRTLPTPAQGSGVSTGTLAVTSVSGDLVIGSTCVGTGSGSMTTMSSTQVTIREKVEGNDIGGFECCCQGDVVASGTSTTVGAQWAGNTAFFVVFGAALIAATGGGGSRPVKMAGNWGGFAGRSGGFAG